MSKCTNSLYLLEKQSERLFTKLYSIETTLKQINPEYSLEGLILKLKIQYFGHLMWRANSLEKTLMLGKIEGRRRSGWQRMRWLDGITDSMDMAFEQTLGDNKGQGTLMCYSPQGHSWTLNNSTTKRGIWSFIVFIGKMWVCPNCTLTLLKWKLRFVLWKSEKYVLCLGYLNINEFHYYPCCQQLNRHFQNILFSNNYRNFSFILFSNDLIILRTIRKGCKGKIFPLVISYVWDSPPIECVCIAIFLVQCGKTTSSFKATSSSDRQLPVLAELARFGFLHSTCLWFHNSHREDRNKQKISLNSPSVTLKGNWNNLFKILGNNLFKNDLEYVVFLFL